MNIKKLINILGVTIICIGMSFHQVSAHKIDKYREMLQNNVYTLIYTTSNVTLHNGVDVNAAMGRSSDASEAIVVRNGKDGYTEAPMPSMPDMSHWMCTLKINGKSYAFNKYIIKGKHSMDKFAGEMIVFQDTETYGNDQAAQVIGSIKLRDGVENEWNRPADCRITDYGFRKQFVSEGVTSEGYSYEDYKVYIMNNVSMIVRYIFDGDNLIGINSLSAQEVSSQQTGSMSYSSKSSIKIKKFTSDVDESYLQLPAGVKIMSIGKMK